MTNLEILEMFRNGEILRDLVLLIGFSGNLPTKSEHEAMSFSERREFWNERVRSNLGPEGLELFQDVLPKEIENFTKKHNWLKEGF